MEGAIIQEIDPQDILEDLCTIVCFLRNLQLGVECVECCSRACEEKRRVVDICKITYEVVFWQRLAFLHQILVGFLGVEVNDIFPGELVSASPVVIESEAKYAKEDEIEHYVPAFHGVLVLDVVERTQAAMNR